VTRPRVEPKSRLILTSVPDPKDTAPGDVDETPSAADTAAPEDAQDDPGEPDDPGVGEAIGGARAAFMRMLDAHITLLRAELQIAGKELGIIVGLAAGALALAAIIGILLYVGSALFLGEWLFGSMGWGIIHGTLLPVAIIGFIGVNLGGGDIRAYGWGALVGLIVGIALSALLLTNVGNETAEWGSRLLQESIGEDALPFGAEWVATLSGLVVGAIIAAIVALLVGWRMHWKFGSPVVLTVVGLAIGGFIGAIYASTRYDAPDGVIGFAIMIGLLTWIIAGLALAARKGFDPEARYANLMPRESIASFEKTRDFLMEQWDKQKGRMMRR
jgi:MFS family permease